MTAILCIILIVRNWPWVGACGWAGGRGEFWFDSPGAHVSTSLYPCLCGRIDTNNSTNFLSSLLSLLCSSSSSPTNLVNYFHRLYSMIQQPTVLLNSHIGRIVRISMFRHYSLDQQCKFHYQFWLLRAYISSLYGTSAGGYHSLSQCWKMFQVIKNNFPSLIKISKNRTQSLKLLTFFTDRLTVF